MTRSDTLGKASKEYKKLMKKVEFLEFFRMQDKAIILINKMLDEKPFSKYESSSAFIKKGYLFLSLKEYESASEMFHKGLMLVQDVKFPYSRSYKVFFKTFKLANRDDLLKFWLNDFNSRIVYDRRFKKFSKYSF